MLLPIAICFLLLVTTLPAQAETYIIQISGVNPVIPAKIATCTTELRPCFLTLSYKDKSGVENYIDVATDFTQSEVRFEFMKDREFLPVRSDGETVVVTNLETPHSITLYHPLKTEKERLVRRPVMRQAELLAVVEVLAFRKK